MIIVKFNIEHKYLLLMIMLLINSSISLAQNYGNWYLINPLNEKRSEHAGIVLYNGNILISGTNGSPSPLFTCEIYDVKSQIWKYIAPMNKGRMYHTLINLKDSCVIAIGGFNENTCEILSKDFDKWTFTDSLKQKRLYGQTTTLLNDGRVLLVGGQTSNEKLRECEIYNPKSMKWEVIDELKMARSFHTATLLQDGRVFITGGGSNSSCEIYDPVINNWTLKSSMSSIRSEHSATLLPNGKVIVIGGGTKKVEVYNPILDTWEVVGETGFVFGSNRAHLIKDGKYLLIVQGFEPPGWEIYDLTNFQSVFFRKFDTIEYGQVFLKINEEKLLLAGGRRIISNGLPGIEKINKCMVYDFNISDINEENLNSSFYDDKPILTCFPNPFNNLININIKIKKPSFIKLILYNIIGQEVDKIFEGYLTQGNYLFKYNTSQTSSGIYFLLLRDKKEKYILKLIHQK